MEIQTRIKLLVSAIDISITHSNSLLSLKPREMLDNINTDTFSDNSRINSDLEDSVHLIDSLQGILNDLLAVRKELIKVGFYNIQKPKVRTDVSLEDKEEQE